MNKNQLAVMWIGILAMLLVSAFPYWYKIGGSIFCATFNPLGRHFIFAPPEVDVGTIWIDLAPLHIEWTVISVITIGLVVIFRGKEK